MAPVSDENYLGVLGPYALLEQVAVGGMAEIYLAKARGVAGFEKFLCLKVIHPNFADDEHFIDMLIDEAKIAVGLNHVNIVQIFDLGRDGKTYFIAMEYIDGADMFKIMRQLSEQAIDVPVDVAAFVAQEICTGLDYAHRKRDEKGRPLNIIHRDISPQNILISTSGEVKIVDFGIAKAASRSRHTQAGVIKGKYYYMSPEQAWGDPMDQRTDIFSAGIILYEVLTGQMLYLEEDTSRLLDMVRKADIPRPSTLRPDIPPQLENVVMKALAKRPADRWQTAHEFQAALTSFLFSYAPDFTPNKVADLLSQAIVERAAQRPPEAVVRWNKPSTRQVNLQHLMSRVDYQPQTEHSVIFRLEELARPAPLSATIGFENEVEADAERTMVTAPPAMFQEMAGGTKANLQDSWQEVENDPTLISRSPLLDVPFPRPQRQQQQASRTSPEVIIPSGPAPVPAGSDNKLPPLPPPFRHQNRPSEGFRRSQLPPAGAPPTAAGKDAPWPAERDTSRDPRPPVPPAEQRLQPDPFSQTMQQLDWGDPPALSGPAAPSPAPVPAFTDPAPPAGSGAPQETSWPPQAAQPAWPPQQAAQPVAQQAWPPQLQAAAAPPGSARAPSVANWPPASNWGQQPAGQAPGASWPAQAASPAAAPIWPQHAGASGSTPGWPAGGAANAFELPAETAGDSFMQRRGRAIFVVAMLLFILGGAGALLLFLLPPAEGDGKINVISVPEGAEVIFNGAAIPSKTPVVIPVVDPKGTHDLEVRLKDYKVYKKTITFPAGDTSVMELAVLTPIFATLKVDSTPAGAEIYIDGEHRGKTPATIDNLTPTGDLRLELRMRGYRPTTETISWEGQVALEKSFQLQRSR